ncbi:MAG: glycerol-3-phosphate dehydrogenase C-terminal domain-containing protein, partial [Chloroflexota bacterium]
INLVSRVFPAVKVTRENIVFQFSGVRPLEYMHAKTTGQITRDHSIMEDKIGDTPVYSLVGGKWTSFRAFSEQVADKTLALLGKTRRANTRSLPIGGGRDYPVICLAQLEFINQLAAAYPSPNLHPKKLFERYGTRSKDVLEYIRAADDQPLRTKSDWTVREVEFLVKNEKAVHVDDLILRRSTLAWLGEVDLPLVKELSQIMGSCLGWSDKQKEDEVNRTIELLKDRHGVVLA